METAERQRRRERGGALQQRSTRELRLLIVAFAATVLGLPILALGGAGASDLGSATVTTEVATRSGAAEPSMPTKQIAAIDGGYLLRRQARQQQHQQQAAAHAEHPATTTAPEATPTSAPDVAPPTTTTTVAPTTTAPPVPSVPVGVWDLLAQCESGGVWDLNTGNGYYGGLQVLASTWVSYGGLEFADLPHLASREQQIAVAERIVAAAGGSYRAWGGCAAALGLP